MTEGNGGSGTPSFSERSLWNKIKSVAKKAGKEVIKLVLMLYFCWRDRGLPEEGPAEDGPPVEGLLVEGPLAEGPLAEGPLAEGPPRWVKAIIIAALIYFISPIDAVPDFLPGGFVDDLGVLGAAAVKIAAYIKPEHRARAQEWVDRIFGPDE